MWVRVSTLLWAALLVAMGCAFEFSGLILHEPASMRAGFPCRLPYPHSLSWQKHGIPVPVTPQTPWSMDENLMHIR